MSRKQPRPTHDLSSGWIFARRRMGRPWLEGRGSGASTEQVQLPHSCNENDTFQFGVPAYQGVCSYRTTFRLPDPPAGCEGRWVLCAGGFYGMAEVWLNGSRLDSVDGQYLGFELDPGQALNLDGENILALHLDNRYRSRLLPARKDPDFLLYGGLAGGMWLQHRPLLHIDEGRTVVRCHRFPEDRWTVVLQAPVVNQAARNRLCSIQWTVFGDGEAPVARSEPVEFPALADAGPRIAISKLNLTSPGLWSPTNPRLYLAEGRLEADGTVLDVVQIRFGLRTAEFRSGAGFFLNGERVDLHGCNRHESVPGLGSALPDSVHRRDAEQLKQLGCNFVRLSHYPQSPAFLDACDELGLMVCAEVASWKSVDGGRWLRAARRQMTAMVERDRNHPSVILWSMGNESRSRTAYLDLRKIIDRLDPDRPVTYAENHLHRARRHKTVGIPDVWGNNYELELLAETAAASRLGNVIMTECCNHPLAVRGDLLEELVQVAVLEQEWQVMQNQPHVAGHAVWGFFDYATEHRRRFRRVNGLCDAWRQPKMAAALFAARYSETPMISLVLTPRYDDPRLARQTPFCRRIGDVRSAAAELHVFSNCNQVSVCCDGGEPQLLGGAPHLVLPMAAVPQEIVATGDRHGSAATAAWHAHGPASRLEIELDVGMMSLAPRETAGFEVRVCDGDGVLARDWNGHVQLTVSGPARVRPYTPEGHVLVSRGTGRCFVTASEAHGTARIWATAERLASAQLDIRVE